MTKEICKPNIYYISSGAKLECKGKGVGHSMWVCIPKRYEKEMLALGPQGLHDFFLPYFLRYYPGKTGRIGKAEAALFWEGVA